MNQLLVWAIEAILIGIAFYVFLRFVRRTRGSRLVRGLATALLVGALGLWALTTALELSELGHILENVTGYAVIVLVIVFQPELRRAVSQLGENKFSSGGAGRIATGTLAELAQAARDMSQRRHGALIAIECETPLDTYVESGVSVDAPVSRMLLESIFHPGSALHDGAVVVRGDRLEAALCLFPLTESRDIQRSTGTRHRAALGITEETDAVALVVSEETGLVSVCRRGEMRAGVPHDEIERALGRAIGAEEGVGTPRRDQSTAGRARRAAELVRRDFAWMAFALLLGAAVVGLAWRDLVEVEPRTLRLVAVAPTSTQTPAPGELLLRLPGEDYRLVGAPTRTISVNVTGSRGQLDRLGSNLAGEVRLIDTGPGPVQLDHDDVSWRRLGPGLSLAWAEEMPELRLDRVGTRAVQWQNAHLDIDTSALDPRFTLSIGDVRFAPAQSGLRGPIGVLERIDRGELPLLLERIVVTADASHRISRHLDLAESLRKLDLALEGAARVGIEIAVVPARRDLEGLTREVALVCLDPQRADELKLWALPAHAQKARFSITTQGLIPASLAAGDPGMLARATSVRHFVEENLRVYVDIADLPTDGLGRGVPVRWTWRTDWRTTLPAALSIDARALAGYERLDVELESESELLLEPVGPPRAGRDE